MTTRQAGFTLVELMIVSVIAALMMAAVYETLIVQEKTYEVGGLMMQDQESLRTSLGILESELREVGAIGDSAIGGSDFAIASSDSVVFRAQRKIAFVCSLSRNEKWMITAALGDPFAAGDSLLVFIDNDSTTHQDDEWNTAVVSSVSSSSDAACQAEWPGKPIQLVKVGSHDMAGVMPGAPVRSYQWVTYGLYEFPRMGWSLGRRTVGGQPKFLVGGLGPPGEGLRFDYYTPAGAQTVDPKEISRLKITVTTDPPGSSRVEPTTLSTNLYLRNN